MHKETNQERRMRLPLLSMSSSALSMCYVATLVICCSMAGASAQSAKGQHTQAVSRNSAPGQAPVSPIAQIRQQQQSAYSSSSNNNNNNSNNQAPISTTASSRSAYQSSGSSAGTKRKSQQPQFEPQQQQTSYGSREDTGAQPTEDPLADSEPALYGSVAGAPGVDFPAYTRIPKTSFTCEGKGFDFGFYADEEAQCQVYHVCWSGRRESFLCGVGTVFNQAILACDYWHSVDCSKSSQFYGVNSELGKAGAEPASGGSQRIEPSRAPAASQPGNSGTGSTYGFRPAAPQQQQQQQIQQQQIQQPQQPQPLQQQYNSDESAFDTPQQQQQEIVQPVYASTKADRPAVSQAPPLLVSSAPSQQRNYQESSSLPSISSANNYQQPQRANLPIQQQQQQQQLQENYPTKGQRPASTTRQPVKEPQRPKFNMDFNQKVNSLIESPVRPPLKTSPATKQRQQQVRQNQQQQSNYAQNAVLRAQQSGSQTLNAGAARKGFNSNTYARDQQQQYDSGSDIDDSQPQPQQQQQQTFDDSPVQTSTPQYGGRSSSPASFAQQQSYSNKNSNIPQQQVLTIRSGNSTPEGGSSSAITTQYDTISAGNSNDSPATNIDRSPSSPSNVGDSYESNLDDSSNANDDFRSSGAKAAASHNQNWYIMRSI